MGSSGAMGNEMPVYQLEKAHGLLMRSEVICESLESCEVIAASQLVHFSLLFPSNRRLPGLRRLELFFSQNISDECLELGYKVFSPVPVLVHRIDNLGESFVARRHCGGLTHLGDL